MSSCLIHSPCSPDQPLANLTSEPPELQVYVGIYFPPTTPPLGQTWVANACQSTCTSTISQEDADLCAARLAQQCSVTPPPTTPPPPPPYFPPNPPPLPPNPPPPVNPAIPGGFACNTIQTACSICPDGTQFCFTVPAGAICGGNQDEANSAAFSYAQTQAFLKRICLSGLVPNCCTNSPFSAVITATTFALPVSWAIVSGSLPPGLTATTGSIYHITGTPTTPGDYSFTLRATNATGSFMQKTFNISVLGIIGDPPQPILNQVYAYQLNGQGGVPPYTFIVVSGTLPTGLTLSTSGLISGTPTVAAATTFVIGITDSAP